MWYDSWNTSKMSHTHTHTYTYFLYRILVCIILQVPISRLARWANNQWNTSSTFKQYTIWQKLFTSLGESLPRTNRIMQSKLASLFTRQKRESHKQYCTHTHTCWDRSPLWDDERLTMSSNTVWVRPQLTFRSLNKLMWGFGKLTLKPASFSLFFLFLYFYFSSSSMSVNARSFHIQQTQNNDETH